MRLKNGEVLAFDAKFRGRLQWKRDRYGNYTTITRDPMLTGSIQRITSPNGRWLGFSYNSDGLISQVQDNSGRTVSYSYTSIKGSLPYYLSQITLPDGSYWQYTWTDNGRIASVINPRGQTMVTNRYTSPSKEAGGGFKFPVGIHYGSGNVNSSGGGGGRGGNNPYAAASPEGGSPPDKPDTTVREFLDRQEYADGTSLDIGYSADANLLVTQSAVTERDGQITLWKFKGSDVQQKIKAYGTPLAQSITYTQDSAHRVLSETDSLGRKTTYTYDYLGNRTSVTRLAGTAQAVTSSTTYDSKFSLPLTITDELGRTTTYSYDANGNVVSITNPLNQVQRFTYDDLGRMLTFTQSGKLMMTLAYSGADLVSMTNSFGNVTRLGNDSLGRTISITDPSGNTTTQAYDDRGRVISYTDPNGGNVGFTLDANGNMTALTDKSGNETHYVFDARDRQVSRQDALKNGDLTTYTANDSPKTFVDRMGRTGTYTYDALNRLTKVTYGAPQGNAGAYRSEIRYTYDAGDRVTAIEDRKCTNPKVNLNCSLYTSSTIARTYDDLNRLLTETTAQGTVTYTYDKVGNRTSMTASGQPTVRYTYDLGNRLTTITQEAGALPLQTVSIAYDNLNRRTQTTLPNGVKMVYGYDEADRLTSINYNKSDGTSLGNLTYGYDERGNIIERGGSLARAVAASTASGAVNANHQLIRWQDQQLTYDRNGNLYGDETYSYVWDERDQLIEVRQGDDTVASFTYDAMGRRTSKAIRGKSVSFLYDGWNIAEEISSNPSLSRTLLNGLGMDERYARLALGSREYFLTDNLGSTIALTDGSQNITDSYAYEPYGATIHQGTSDNPYQYTGRENDSIGHLMYYRARYYDTDKRRWLSEDPIGIQGGINLYGYVGGNPVRWNDPLGLVCGSGWNDKYVLDWIWTDACQRHDECYSTCGADKRDCDYDFLWRSGNIFYYVAVYYLGDEPYREAQKEACACSAGKHSK